MKFTVAVLCLGSAAGFTASSFSGSALKATGNDSTMLMATGMGVNGFGRIGRLGTLPWSCVCLMRPHLIIHC
jgi:glyceraldehyde 3-phosphate dehydrogenase